MSIFGCNLFLSRCWNENVTFSLEQIRRSHLVGIKIKTILSQLVLVRRISKSWRIRLSTKILNIFYRLLWTKFGLFTTFLCKIAQVHLPNKNISAILRYFSPVICELAFNFTIFRPILFPNISSENT